MNFWTIFFQFGQKLKILFYYILPQEGDQDTPPIYAVVLHL